MRAERATFLVAVALISAAGLAPLLAVLAESLTVDGRPTLAFYETILRSPRQWALLGNSLLLASTVAAGATLTGLPLAILLAKTDLPFSRTLTALYVLPLLLPPYVVAVAWFHVLGRGGIVSRWLGAGVAEHTHTLLFGLPGAALVLITCLTPVVLLLAMAFLRTVPPQLEQAARLEGPWRRVLAGITVPLVLPGVLLGALLVFVIALGEFAVPMFLRYDVYAVESFTRFAAFYQPEAAAAAAVPLGLVVLTLVAVERWLLRDRTYEVRLAGSSAEALRAPLGRLRLFVCGGVVVTGAAMVGLPLGSLAARSADLVAYSQAVARGWDAILRSLAYALTGATVLTLLGFFLGYLIQRRALTVWRSVDSLTVLLFALPSSVMGIGLVALWNRPGMGVIYGTAWLVLVGYVAQYTALTSRTTVAGLSAVPRSLEEAARLAGAGWLRSAALIVAPLARRALLVAWLIAYLFCLRDTGLTMMIYPPGGDTLPVRTFTLMANGDPRMIAALCILMIITTLLPLAIIAALLPGRFRPVARPAIP